MSFVNLALQPQSDFKYTQGIGLAGAAWPPILELAVPLQQFKRTIYLNITNSTGAIDYSWAGNLSFYSRQRLIGDIFFNRSAANVPTLFPNNPSTASNAGSRVFGSRLGSADFFHAPLFDMNVECDKIVFGFTVNTPGAGNPIWFFACLSSSLW